jgi:hypothetical protein
MPPLLRAHPVHRRRRPLRRCGRTTGPPAPRSDADHGRRAAELLATELPRSAQRAERLVLRVLHVAGQGAGPADDDAIRQAARAIRLASADPGLGVRGSVADARRLGDAARAALRRGAPLAEAVSWQTRAFGADPEDAEIAGTLAAWTLLQSPAEPQMARQLALHALTLPDPRHPQGRLEDWATFATASSLAGRAREAHGAWAVALAVASATGHEGRACRAGLDAVARHGERLRAPVEAMLQRLQAGRGTAVGMASSPFCEWPPHWQAAAREPGPSRP